MSIPKGNRMLQYVNYRMRITLDDSRTLVGRFMAFDKHMNIVLADCEEFRKSKKKDVSEKRALGLVLLRGESVVSLSVESPPPPPTPKKRPALGRGEMPAGRGVVLPAGRGAPLGRGAPAPGLAGPVPGVGAPAAVAVPPIIAAPGAATMQPHAVAAPRMYTAAPGPPHVPLAAQGGPHIGGYGRGGPLGGASLGMPPLPHHQQSMLAAPPGWGRGAGMQQMPPRTVHGQPPPGYARGGGQPPQPPPSG